MPNRELEALSASVQATKRLRLRPSRALDELDAVEAEVEAARSRPTPENETHNV